LEADFISTGYPRQTVSGRQLDFAAFSFMLREHFNSRIGEELMKFAWISALSVLAAVTPAAAGDSPKVALETDKGKIVIELYPDKAPQTVRNFLDYVDSGQYDGTIFHRVIPNFMIQGGGMTASMKEKPTKAPIKNEADNGLKNQRGAIAMARTQVPDSATAQFFINTVDNDFLNFKNKTIQGWGYAVFGKVVEGMDVVDAVTKVKTASRGGHQDVPVDTVMIVKAERVK
jgi:peptidyl-prolyl cis-trans isomerase B (cyclophilin B)